MSFLKYQDWIDQHKESLRPFVLNANAFRRDRKLTLTHTVGNLLYLVSQRNLNGYEISSQNYFAQYAVADTGVSRSSLSEARSKLSWEAFQFLLRELNQENSSHFSHLRWKGHHVKAVDGTFLTLPATPEVLQSFPRRPNPHSEAHYPYALLVTASNVLTGQPVCARLKDHLGSERASLIEMLDEFQKGDVLLLDRGFEGIKTWEKIRENGLFFICRVRAQGNLSASLLNFLKSGQHSVTVDISIKIKGEVSSMPIRFVRGPKDRRGLPIVLATNLYDGRRYTSESVFDLYLKRWKIETLYYRLKELFRLEKFHAKTLNGVLQEVWANLLMLSLTALVANASEPPENKNKALNFKAVTEWVRRNFLFFIKLPESLRLGRRQWRKRLDRLLLQIFRIRCHRQPGRKNPRISKQPSTCWQRKLKDQVKIKRERLQNQMRQKRRLTP